MELDMTRPFFFMVELDDFLGAEVHDLQWILVIGCQWELTASLRWQQLKPRMLGILVGKGLFNCYTL